MRAAGGDLRHGNAGTPDEPLFADARGKVKRVVRDHDPSELRWNRCKPLANAMHIGDAQSPFAPRESPRGIHADHEYLVVLVFRGEIARNVAPIAIERG